MSSKQDELRNAILNSHKPKIKKVEENLSGSTLYVRTMDLGQWSRIAEIKTEPNQNGDKYTNEFNTRNIVIIHTCCDEHGNLLFTEEDVGRLNRMSFKLADKIFEAAHELNRLSMSEDEESAQDEALKKNK